MLFCSETEEVPDASNQHDHATGAEGASHGSWFRDVHGSKHTLDTYRAEKSIRVDNGDESSVLFNKKIYFLKS